jgi:hypothetical protein
MFINFFQSVYAYLLVPIMIFLTPLIGLFYLMSFLIVLDLITAIYRDFKLKKSKTLKQKIRRVKSRKLRRSVVKWFLYMSFITAVYSIPFICFGNGFMMAEIMTSTLAIIELKSIAENMDIINESDIFTSLSKKFVKWLNEKINSGIENPN